MSRKEDAASLQKIQSEIDECTALLETLRGRFEQYFQGSERIPPDQQRKDLFRRIHHLEHQTLNNTSAKFRLQNLSQKFRSYNEYWSRTLRQIEDGTYSRHVAKAKKNRRHICSREPRFAASGDPSGDTSGCTSPNTSGCTSPASGL